MLESDEYLSWGRAFDARLPHPGVTNSIIARHLTIFHGRPATAGEIAEYRRALWAARWRRISLMDRDADMRSYQRAIAAAQAERAALDRLLRERSDRSRWADEEAEIAAYEEARRRAKAARAAIRARLEEAARHVGRCPCLPEPTGIIADVINRPELRLAILTGWTAIACVAASVDRVIWHRRAAAAEESVFGPVIANVAEYCGRIAAHAERMAAAAPVCDAENLTQKPTPVPGGGYQAEWRRA